MTPKYYVSLGGINLHQVNSFELTSFRDIETYDGIGSGRFNVPDAHDPREWTINCQLLQDGGKLSGLNTWSASELFKAFESWLEKTDAPIRMVKTDLIYPAANISALVWFKSYHPKEADFQGVYDTEIVVTEYKPVGIKTTGLPTVNRPGKVPVPAKVTITKSNTVYKTKAQTGVGTKTDVAIRDKNQQKAQYARDQYLQRGNDGKPVTNAATIKDGTSLLVATVTNKIPTSPVAPSINYSSVNSSRNAWDGMAESVKSTFSWIGNGIENWLANPFG